MNIDLALGSRLQMDEDTAPVLGIAFAAGVAGLLQAVQDDGHAACREPSAFGQLARRQRPHQLQQMDALHISRVHPKLVGNPLIVEDDSGDKVPKLVDECRSRWILA